MPSIYMTGSPFHLLAHIYKRQFSKINSSGLSEAMSALAGFQRHGYSFHPPHLSVWMLVLVSS